MVLPQLVIRERRIPVWIGWMGLVAGIALISPVVELLGMEIDGLVTVTVGSDTELERIVTQIRARWPKTRIIVRGSLSQSFTTAIAIFCSSTSIPTCAIPSMSASIRIPTTRPQELMT